MSPRKRVVVLGDREADVLERRMQIDTWGYCPVWLRELGIDTVHCILVCSREVRAVRDMMTPALEHWPDTPVIVMGSFTESERASLYHVGAACILEPKAPAILLRETLAVITARKRGPKPGCKMPPRGVARLAMAMEAV